MLAHWRRLIASCDQELAIFHARQAQHTITQIDLDKQVKECDDGIKRIHKERRASLYLIHHPIFSGLATFLPMEIMEICEQYSSFRHCSDCSGWHPKSLRCLKDVIALKPRIYIVHTFTSRIDNVSENGHIEFGSACDQEIWDFIEHEICVVGKTKMLLSHRLPWDANLVHMCTHMRMFGVRHYFGRACGPVFGFYNPYETHLLPNQHAAPVFTITAKQVSASSKKRKSEQAR